MPNDESIKICANCKHYKFGTVPVCKKSVIEYTNLVDGSKRQTYAFCETARTETRFGKDCPHYIKRTERVGIWKRLFRMIFGSK
jgi:hypothetical protein